MRCLSCQKLSFELICKECQNNLLSTSLHTREVDKDFFVYSFFNYSEISELLNAKYHFFGDNIYKILAKNSFAKFASNFTFTNQVYAISIDDMITKEFSHSAILAKHLHSNIIKPYFNVLQAKNRVSYAGKSLEFRKNNKRDFEYSGKKYISVILVDDIITTGSTMLEAKKKLEEYGCDVLMGLVLSDAKF
ncbi:ComF family protein [Arcobacter sp. FWKO B]|uniref:ComF family protein n=1 Tax=Arcobacter sp. FWKO B TaxID=2593672 RepID=UPI0018A6A09F|nr:phosphoribosyltransferase family protein [Arcobacter sp. FWKO B]QOG11597.1 ComF family protein [Arcobacter sp. FWKO B]